MDIGLREWLIIGGVLVIGLIIFDGWRRMKGQRNTLKIDIDRSLSDSIEGASGSDAHNPELPNGGARAQKGYDNETFHSHVSDEKTVAEARIDPGFEHLNDYLDRDSADYGSTAAPKKVEMSKEALEKTEQILTRQVELDPLFDDIPDILSPVRRVAEKAEEKLEVKSQEQIKEETQKNAVKSQQSSDFFDLEQPITVLMRQASEKHDEDASLASTQEEMFFYPEAAEAPKAETSEGGEESTGLDSGDRCSHENGEHTKIDDGSLQERETLEKYSHLEESHVHESLFAEEVVDSEDKLTADVDVKVFEAPENERYNEPEESDDLQRHVVQSEGNATGLSEQDSLFETEASIQKDRLEHARSDRKAREHAPEPEEVLVITVVAKQQPLDGQTLLQVVLACGMRFGDMNLFHRFEEGIDKGAVQFSMANAVNPGTFDLEHMDQMTTPGVSFFMSMGEPVDVKNAFECMLATAETVSKHVGGDLLDENRSVMRPQTKAHYRERIREYEMHNRHRRK